MRSVAVGGSLGRLLERVFDVSSPEPAVSDQPPGLLLRVEYNEL
jgi:hypothetical protein